jgi:two-component system, OmpR family, sensor histidine kinase KdpD
VLTRLLAGSPAGSGILGNVARGTLRIYLGAAPGVGKTFAMLNEGRRSAERGRDVVVGLVETHGRPQTEQAIGDLPVLPRRQIDYRDQTWHEMDLDAIIARKPEIVLVDELAHTNVPGSEHTKRWKDVAQLLDAGISVISTVNIQHIESLNDVIRQITGVLQRETVPDSVVRSADQIELVDMSPESLRRRMAHGNIYKGDRVDRALANYFRVGNLSALRELALLWVADRVDDGLQEYREHHGITEPWETKERVIVALTGSPQGARMIRRGARMAARQRAELVGVHIRATDGVTRGDSGEALALNRALLTELGGRYAEVAGNDVASALVGFAKAENATQLILGATTRSRWNELVQGSVINDVIRRATGIEVHVLSGLDDQAAAPAGSALPHIPRPGHLSKLPPRRQLAGWLLAVIGMPALVLALVPLRGTLGEAGSLPELLFGVVIVALVGGPWPALTGALLGFLLADYYLIPPLHSLTINRTGDAAGLVTFLVVAAIVSGVIDRLTRRGLQVARARSESEALARLAGGAILAPQEALPNLVAELRTTFGAEAVAILVPDGEGWKVLATAGVTVPQSPEGAAYSAELNEGSVLVVTGDALTADDRRLLYAFVSQLRAVQERQQLTETAAAITDLEQANELRMAVLTAISHDLRTPLASIKASATSLLSDEVSWSEEDRRTFYETIDTEAARLDTLVGNLLDLTRLQTGVVPVQLTAVGLEEVVFAALSSLSTTTASVRTDVPETLPAVLADPALLERSVANLLSNALAWNQPGAEVLVSGGETTARAGLVAAGARSGSSDGSPFAADEPSSGGEPSVVSTELQHLVRSTEASRLELRISDHGPGIPDDKRGEVFAPFERLGDRPGQGDGVGLGLAVARGFVELMGGTLALEDTPGGGLTAVISLPLA